MTGSTVWRIFSKGRKGLARSHASTVIEEWLMKNDFELVEGHKFNFRADPMPHWNGVTDCEVLAIEPYKRLSYTGNASGA
ncbi:conserved hypothetical protein [Burkholderiales bacterium]|jgi:uncharacterized protein YndB with AHSA1/START domain|nr:conserved hypothetical protein [Burkholderiales bacterium]